VPDGRILADFEGDDYGGWRASGDALGKQPVHGTLPKQQAVSGFRGRGLVNTFLSGDGAQGTLTSPEFEIDHDYLSFLIGGGNHAGKTCLNLLRDGRVVRTATGDADEHLNWKSWDVRALRGKKAVLEIVDHYTAGWGHINVDHILLADQPARPASDGALWADYGRDFYAAVSWSDIPKTDGRRLWIGWMSNWEYANDVPTSPWRSAMSVPRELGLRTTPEGLRLFQRPVRELAKLRGTHHQLGAVSLEQASDWLKQRKFDTQLLEIEIDFAAEKDAGKFGLKLMTAAGEETLIICDLGASQLRVDRTHSGRADFHKQFSGTHSAPLRVREGRVSLHILLDASSIEVFGNDGEAVVTDLILPSPGSRSLELFSEGRPHRLKQLHVWELNSACK